MSKNLANTFSRFPPPPAPPPSSSTPALDDDDEDEDEEADPSLPIFVDVDDPPSSFSTVLPPFAPSSSLFSFSSTMPSLHSRYASTPYCPALAVAAIAPNVMTIANPFSGFVVA